jgi:hypothetical protein
MYRDTATGLTKHAGLLQLLLVTVVLLGCVVLPRPDGAVLLVPLFTPSIGLAGMGHVAVLRGGWIAGSVLVRVDGPMPLIAWLRGGVLPLGVPDWLCSSVPASNRRLEKADLP